MVGQWWHNVPSTQNLHTFSPALESERRWTPMSHERVHAVFVVIVPYFKMLRDRNGLNNNLFWQPRWHWLLKVQKTKNSFLQIVSLNLDKTPPQNTIKAINEISRGSKPMKVQKTKKNTLIIITKLKHTFLYIKIKN